jgi:hypothetical protein
MKSAKPGSSAKTEKIDFYKLHKAEYAALRKPSFIETKPAMYLSISGRGAPGGEDFQARIGALYSMAFTIKMTRKFEGREDYAVSKLESQYWCDAVEGDFSRVPQDEWQWTLLIRTPDFIMQEDLDKAGTALEKRGKSPLAREVKLLAIDEGRCVQMLHVGPYEREKETLEKMSAFAAGKGFAPHGRHHEIYLSDPRRIPPERLKTILRLPIRESMASYLQKSEDL